MKTQLHISSNRGSYSFVSISRDRDKFTPGLVINPGVFYRLMLQGVTKENTSVDSYIKGLVTMDKIG
jgi:hypothetical protein